MTRRILLVICLGGCIGLGIVMSVLVVQSWSRGPSGDLIITFNQFHERLIETILFPTWTLGSLIGTVWIIKTRRLL